ncbi:MAG TPA: MoxR family ATPase, partial [Actinomycetes bacterium]|nr:MoxR family ATPase [Actinomycetes bacterium]
MSDPKTPAWCIYQGHGLPPAADNGPVELPEPPSWRTFDGGPPLPTPPASEAEFTRRLGVPSTVTRPKASIEEILTVNAAL